MAFPFAAVALGASVLGSGAAMVQNGKLNKKNRDWQEKMRDQNNAYDLERWHESNAYNEAQWDKTNKYNEGLWNKQNEYNQTLWNQQNAYDSPEQQMARYKAAGLNPNLIYGQMGNGGGISTAQLESQPAPGASPTPRSHSAQHQDRPMPNLDLASGVMAYADIKQKAAQTNNLEALNHVYEQDALLRSQQVAETGARIAGMTQDTRLKSDLYQTSVDAAKANLRKIETETDISLSRNEREAAMQSSNLAEAAARIAKMRNETITEGQKQQLNELDLSRKKMGIEPSDNMFFRMLGRFFSEQGDGGSWLKNNTRLMLPNRDGSYYIGK